MKNKLKKLLCPLRVMIFRRYGQQLVVDFEYSSQILVCILFPLDIRIPDVAGVEMKPTRVHGPLVFVTDDRQVVITKLHALLLEKVTPEIDR